jgi:predicted MFS family arabinose efflux permease
VPATQDVIYNRHEKKGTFPLHNYQFLLIFVIAFFIYCSSQMLSLTLPKYANEMGAGSQAVGLLAGIFAMCALCVRPVSGQIVDNENRKVMLRVVLLVMLVSVFALTLSKNYWLLVVFRGLNGLAWGVGSTLCMTIATDCFSDKNMAGGIGIYGLGQTIAQTIAPTFALPLANRFGYNNLYRINVSLILVCLLLTFLMKAADTAPKERKYSVSLKNMIHTPAILPASLTLCSSGMKSSIMAFLVIFAETMSIEGIGLYFTVQAITIFTFRPLLSKLADKLGLIKILIPCEALAITGMVLISFAGSLPSFLIAAVCMGISAGGEQPILMAECVKSAEPSKRGRASNTSYIGTDIGHFLGSNLSGLCVAYMGYRRMYLAVTVPLIVCTVVFVVLYKQRSHPFDSNSKKPAANTG